MFDDQTTPPLNPQPKTANNKVVDIFEGIDKKPAANPQLNAIGPKPLVAAPAGNPAPFNYEDHGGKKHKIMFLVVIAIVVIVLVYVAGKIYFMKTTPSQTPSVVAPAENISPAETTEQPAALPSENLPNIPAPLPADLNATTVDGDNDGLPDAQEAEFGTNPLKADTDSDGLGDYDEAIIYKTNPLNPDTDGDSYLDGEEVTNGYDPKGPGKLLNMNATSPAGNATVSSNSTK